MNKSLVIVESPAKARTINKYLGEEYEVHSCVGHVRDLPKSGGGRKKARERTLEFKIPAEGEKYAKVIRSMGINPYDNWKAYYEILADKKKIIAELKSLATKSPVVYLATDQDREGEAIAWHLSEILGREKEYKRVTFSEITESAIQKSFAEPHPIDQDQVSAQHARRFLDRVVGYMLSPLLWKKVARGLSAGRVQSVAVRLIVEREREIRRFIPQEYWDLALKVKGKEQPFTMQVTKQREKPFKPTCKEEMDAALANLKDTDLQVTSVQDKEQVVRPSPPFITSTLQQSASTVLGYTVKRTMIAAQKLYEAGHITYMRTDSFNLSAQSLQECRTYIKKVYGEKYLPEKTRYYKRGNQTAQQAHEAIRPTRAALEAEKLPGSFGITEKKLYDLIRRRFIACQMNDARFKTLKVIAQAKEYEMSANGRQQKFDGFMRIMPVTKEENVLPHVEKGESLKIMEFLPKQHWTKPPVRYGEAALVRELEKRSIGRPSTYAPIISTIQERGYVYLHKKRFYAEKIAEIVTDRLNASFQNILDYDFSADMEQLLDSVSEGKEDWQKVLNNFYHDFILRLEQASEDNEKGMLPNHAVSTSLSCSKCGRNMVIRNSARGIFLACSGYEEKDDQCKNTVNLESAGGPDLQPKEIEEEKIDEDEKPASPPRQCLKCEAPMLSYVVDEKHRMHVCENNPNCSGVQIEEGDFTDLMPKNQTLECERCGGKMELLSGKFGKYYACESCDNKRRLLKNGQPAPPVMKPVQTDIPCSKYPDSQFILREGAMGLFLAAPGFPKQRETRSLYVDELKPYKDQLPEQFHYLMVAPDKDDERNPSQIRYSRKLKQNYLLSVKNDEESGKEKDTGWRAYYENNKWEITHEKPKALSGRSRAKPATTK